MRELWDTAPTVAGLAGQSVSLAGYLVPLDEAKDGIRDFLLVPYFGACIHTPPPPANQIVHVRSQTPIKGFRTMDAVWVSGTLELDRSKTDMGVSGYTMTRRARYRPTRASRARRPCGDRMKSVSAAQHDACGDRAVR